MAIATTNTVLNFSGLLTNKTDETTRILDAIIARGKGTSKVASFKFVSSSGYSLRVGSQPSISETASLTAPISTSITRDQQTNAVQIFHQTVAVSYAKASARAQMAGVNIAGQQNNVMDELTFQVDKHMKQNKKDLNFTCVNGVYAESTGDGVAWGNRGLSTGITSNVVTAAIFTPDMLNSAIENAIPNGFEMSTIELWCNPADLKIINDAYSALAGFTQIPSNISGGVAITTILTNFGTINVHWDIVIPQGTIFLLNLSEIGLAEMDVIMNGEFKGTWFYEELSKTGAGTSGQLYAQAGINYGAEWKHIKISGITPVTEAI